MHRSSLERGNDDSIHITRSDGVTLNVGQVRVLDVGTRLLTLYLEGPRSPLKARGVSFREASNSHVYAAVSVPSFRAEIELDRVEHLPLDYRRAHNQLIASAAARKRVSPFKISYSPAVVAVFREMTGGKLPDPSWYENNAATVPEQLLVWGEVDTGGFGDPATNRAIEVAAVEHVANTYRKKGWSVRSVEALKCGYDLRCAKGKVERHVEVKACAADADKFIVTANEHAVAFSDPLFRIAIVSHALSESRQVHEFTAKQFQSEFEFRPIHYWARHIASD